MLSPYNSFRHPVVITWLSHSRAFRDPPLLAKINGIRSHSVQGPYNVTQTHFSSFSPNLFLHVPYDSINWTVRYFPNVPHTPSSQSLSCDLSPLMTVILVHSGCYNKTTIGWVAYTTSIYFSQFWSLRSSRSRLHSIGCLVRACFLVHRHLSPHMDSAWMGLHERVRPSPHEDAQKP